jgi:polysaccharide biosynthesis transport protein
VAHLGQEVSVGGDSVDDDVIDVRDQVAVLRRRWLIVVVTTLLGLGAAATLSLTQTRMYLANTQLLVEPLSSASTSNGVVMTPEEVATQVEVITSLPVAATVVHDLGLDESPETLLKSVTVSSVSDTRVLTISVLRPRAGGAAAIANSFADSYLKYRTNQASEQRRTVTRSYTSALAVIRGQLSHISDKLETVPPGERPGLKAQQQALTIQFSQVSSELAALNSSDVDALGGGQVLVPAAVPTSPAQPRPLRNVLLGAIVGLLLGTGLAFIRDHFDDGIRDEARLRDATSGRPVLGQIPHWTDDRTGRLATIIDPASPVSEAYRALSTNVRFMLAASRDDGSGESQSRILLVSSASPSEGKTSVSSNLAVAAARVGLQVILVDADLRHPMLSRSFGLQDSPGLSDVLASGDSADEYLFDVGIPNLRVLAGGSIPPNPAELLASTAAASVLRKLRDDADLLIVDSAPVLRVADALELMTTADLVLMVARRGVSHMRPIAATVERINQAGGRVSGSVLNDIDSRASGYTYGYHGPVTRTVPAAAEPPPARTPSPQPASDAGLGILRWSKRRNGDDGDDHYDTSDYDTDASATNVDDMDVDNTEEALTENDAAVNEEGATLNEDDGAVLIESDGGAVRDEDVVHDSDDSAMPDEDDVHDSGFGAMRDEDDMHVFDAEVRGQDHDEEDGVDAPDSSAPAPAEPRSAASPNGLLTAAGHVSDRENDQPSPRGDDDAEEEQPERTVNAGVSSWSGAGHASQGRFRRRRPRR